MSSDLKANYFTGLSGYNGVLGTNVTPPTDESASINKLLFAATNGPNAVEADETGSLTDVVDVPPGATIFMGGIGNWQDGSISGCWMQVQRPNGEYLNVATSPNATGQMVILPPQSAPANSVMAFAIIDPEPGSWRVTIGSEDSMPLFQAMVSTVPQMAPGQKPISLMEETLAVEVTNSGLWEHDSRTSFKCFGCKSIAYPLALGITIAVGAASTAILTAESAVIVATAGFLAISAPAALGLVGGLIAGGILTIDFVLGNLCTWAGACD